MALLEVEDLRAGYGSQPVLGGVSFSVEEGETAVLLGLNGVGKTTTVANIAGLYKPWGGQIRFDGRPVTGTPAAELVKMGISLVPEGRRCFPALTVAQNLRLGAWTKRRDKGENRATMERVFDYFPRLQERVDQLAGTLSGGEQQMLAIARVMMAGARIILMDEPTQGLAPALVRHIREMIEELKRLGVTVLLVEQNARMALSVSDRGYIMEKGQIVFEGPAKALRESPVTREKLGV
jgi:branched-chain amino acid transport system ATP-binding protein